MTPADYATITGAVLAVISGFAGLLRWMIKHYLAELKPNSGSSLRDSVNRLETRVDKIYEMLLER